MTELGFQGEHIKAIKALLANCPTWQEVCGVETETAASAYIHEVEVMPEPETPYAVVSPGDTTFSALGTGHGFAMTGTVDVSIYLSPPGATQAAKFYALSNAVTQIAIEMQALAINGYAVIRNIEIPRENQWRFTDPERRGRGEICAAQMIITLGAQ